MALLEVSHSKKRGIKRKKNITHTKEKKAMKEIIPQIVIPPVRNSDDPLPKKVKWINRTRVLVFSSRGINYRDRHFMEDLKRLMPHSKPDVKSNTKKQLEEINEMAEMKNCSKVLYFEPRKQKDLYLWISDVSRGPSVKFLVQNVHTMHEMKLTGNCLKGSRPLLIFDTSFNSPHWLLIKELIVQIFGVPKGHPKSQPFFDKVYVFSLLDEKIWFRNYQIVEEDGQLTEIGPRFVLNPIKIFSGSFGGPTLWSNKHYMSPNNLRHQMKEAKSMKYVSTITQKASKARRLKGQSFKGDPTSEFFETTENTQLKLKKKKRKVKVKS